MAWKTVLCSFPGRNLIEKEYPKNHIHWGNKHKDAKDRLAKKQARERDTTDSLVVYDKAEQPAGMSVSIAERVFRVKVVKNFLRTGIPLAKVDNL